MKTASELNKSCPIMIDKETRLDNAIALPKKVFQYSYTLINIDRNLIDTVQLKEILEPQITNTVSTHPDMKMFRDKKITLKYYYKDMEGNYLCAIVITPDKYR
jgi:hypothetical protein